MSDERSRGSSASQSDNVVDPAPDPMVTELTRHQQTASDDAEFAQAEASFAVQEHKHALQLRQEGRWQEAEGYDQDARYRMRDADTVMQHALAEENEASRLREEKKRNLALELQQMPNHGVATLRAAVGEVRLFVQDMAPSDKLKVGLALGLTEEGVDEVRERIVVTGFAIEQALATEATIRSDPRRVITDLVTFTAAVMTLADHLPALMDLLNRFGQMLVQFHL